MTTEELIRNTRIYRERCLNDVLFLGREILGYELLRDEYPVMRELAEQAAHVGDTLSLIPRSWCKTTVISVVGSIWYNLHYPNDCTLITSNKDENAIKILGEITDHYKRTENFRVLFPEFCPPDETHYGTATSFRCLNQKPGRKECTFEATGMNAAVTSRHYERIVIDDVVYKENVAPAVTPSIMAKTWDYIRSLTALMKLTSNRCFRVVVGTRWNDGDAYGELLNDKAFAHFRKLVLSPVDEDGNSRWPEIFPEEKLERIRREMGDYLWACLMLQDPMPPESAVSFEKDWIKEYAGSPPGDEHSVAITIDPAFSKDYRSDRTAIAITDVPSNRSLYVLDAKAGRWTPFEIADHAFSMYALWASLGFQPEWIGVEEDVGGKAIISVLKRVRNERDLNIRIRALSTGQQSKPARIAELSAYAEMHGIRLRRNMSALRDEILRYPVGKHDDLLDVLAHRVRILSKQYEHKQVEEQSVVRAITIPPRTGADILKRRESPAGIDLLRIFP